MEHIVTRGFAPLLRRARERRKVDAHHISHALHHGSIVETTGNRQRSKVRQKVYRPAHEPVGSFKFQMVQLETMAVAFLHDKIVERKFAYQVVYRCSAACQGGLERKRPVAQGIGNVHVMQVKTVGIDACIHH